MLPLSSRVSRYDPFCTHFSQVTVWKKKMLIGSFWDPDRYLSQKLALYIRIPHKNSGKEVSHKVFYLKGSGTKNIANLEKSFIVFSGEKKSTFRYPERNSCRIFLKLGSFDPHSCQYFYTLPKHYPKVRESRVIWLYIFLHDNFFFLDLINKCQ